MQYAAVEGTASLELNTIMVVPQKTFDFCKLFNICNKRYTSPHDMTMQAERGGGGTAHSRPVLEKGRKSPPCSGCSTSRV